MIPVLAFGEALIDFVPSERGRSLADVESFSRAPGGAPANVAACIVKLGGTAQFAGQLGADAFGDYLVRTLRDIGVGTRWIQRTDAAKTALAFVTLTDAGEREFAFYRDPSADMLFPANQVRAEWFEGDGIFHFGTLSMSHPVSRAATLRAVTLARQAGWLVSFDPNARLELWPSPSAFVDAALAGIEVSDLVKVSEDEHDLLSANGRNPSLLLGESAKAVIITRGALGVRLVASGIDVELPGWTVPVVDTTGAGDAFVGAWLYGLASHDVTASRIQSFLLKPDAVRRCLAVANACAALSVTGRGAIPSMPTLADVHALVASAT